MLYYLQAITGNILLFLKRNNFHKSEYVFMEKLLSVTAPLAFSIFSSGFYKDDSTANYELINFFLNYRLRKSIFFLHENDKT